MSVHPVTIPDWSRHKLAEKYRRLVEWQASRYGLGPSDAEEVAERTALRLCLEGQFAGTPEEVDAKFKRRTKYALLQRLEELKAEPSAQGIAERMRSAFGEEAPTVDTVYDRTGAATLPNQIEYTYLREVLRFLDKLPKDHRRVMRKIASGMTPLEIATREQVSVEAVLNEIHTAREWIADHAEWGE